MTWKYIDLLNENIRILLTIALGIVLGRFRVFDAKPFVPQAVRFVFYVALPCLVVKGIGTGVDFYAKTNIWAYIGVFLILRAIALIAAFLWVACMPTKDKDGRQQTSPSSTTKSHTTQHHHNLGNVSFQKKSLAGIGQVAVIWLCLTWISTVILGIPISTAVFGSPMKGARYGLLAGISSFIFQLPLQLLFLECHRLETQLSNNTSDASKTTDVESPAIAESPIDEEQLEDIPIDSETPETLQEKNKEENDDIQGSDDSNTTHPLLDWIQFAGRKDIWIKIGIRLLHNPVLWGIVIGFILSLSTIGPTYLNPKKPTYYQPMGWFWYTADWLGNCVTPLSLFTMGVWMADQGKNLFRISLRDGVLFMLSKLVIVPLIVLGLAKAVNLNNEAGRAAVLIAALPISMASFSLGSQFQIGENVLAANVTLGTLFILPTILLWNLVLDAVGLFPLTAVPAGN